MSTQDDREHGVARAAARRMRAVIIDREDGSYLGSEEDLKAQFSLSRAALRQAARILEHEQLLVVRRGVGGGYFVRRPSVQAVARSAAIYLQAHRTSMNDIVRIARIFAMETAGLAAGSTDPDAREHLAQLRVQIASQPDDGYAAADVMSDEARIVDALLQLANAPTLALFQRILHEFGRRDRTQRIYHDRPDRCAQWRRARLALVDAVLARDTEMATLLARRQNELSQSWLEKTPRDDVPLAIAAE